MGGRGAQGGVFGRRAPLRALLLTPALLAAVAQPALASEPGFRVGAAKVDIGPSVLLGPDRTEEVCLGGYGLGCSRPAKGEREPLYARAIVIEAEGRKVAIVTSTNIGLFAKYKPEIGDVGAYDIRRAAALATGIPSASIVLTSDHSHSSPDVEGIWGGVSHEYMRKHATAVVQAIVRADAALEPASIVVGAASTDDPLDNHWAGTGGVLDQVDRELRVLQARRADGSAVATLVNFAPHASTLDEPDDLASGDWTGVTGNLFGDRWGGVGMSLVGALGGIGPGRDGESGLNSFVALVDDLVQRALADARPLAGGGVAAARTFIREPLTAPLLYAGFAPHTRDLVDPVGASINRAVSPPWSTGNLVGTYVSALRIGDVLVAGAPGEAYPEISFALSRAVSGAGEHLLLGLADDQLGYLISPLEGFPTAARNGATYPLAGNDNFALAVSPTIGDHVACSLLDLARRLDFQTAAESERCAGLTSADGVAAPAETP